MARKKLIFGIIVSLFLLVLFGGCIVEKNVAPAPDLTHKEAADISPQILTQSSKEENIPEITILSFSSIYGHRNLENRGQVLFTWENIPGNESNKLLSFLKNDLGIIWAWRPNLDNQNEKVNITKDEKNKTIRVFTNYKSIDITLFDDSAWLKSSEVGMYQWQVKEENGDHNFLKSEGRTSYNLSQEYFAVYELKLKNNGSTNIDFKLNDLRLHEGDRIFNSSLEPCLLCGLNLLEVFQNLAKENKIHDTTLLPGESLNGTVVFRVNSLYDESLLLMYNKTPVTSSSFEKSLVSLRTAEKFNYSVALGVPPYCNCNERGGIKGTYEPMFDNNCDTFANWVNRSIFDTFQKSDVERMQKSSPENIPMTEMAYALRVIPEKNISMFPIKNEFYFATPLIIDDMGEEMINSSGVIAGLGVLSNGTYKSFRFGEKLNTSRMRFSNATVVQISFEGTYGEPMGQRMSFVNQIIILDDELNIIAVSYEPDQFVS